MNDRRSEMQLRFIYRSYIVNNKNLLFIKCKITVEYDLMCLRKLSFEEPAAKYIFSVF